VRLKLVKELTITALIFNLNPSVGMPVLVSGGSRNL